VTSCRKASRELDALLAELYPQKPAEPSTFGLRPGELCAEARRLRRSGWSTGEVLSVLDVDARCAA
jgi:hypothetical protein